MIILISVVIALVATYRVCHWVKLNHTVIASTTASRCPALRLLSSAARTHAAALLAVLLNSLHTVMRCAIEILWVLAALRMSGAFSRPRYVCDCGRHHQRHHGVQMAWSLKLAAWCENSRVLRENTMLCFASSVSKDLAWNKVANR